MFKEQLYFLILILIFFVGCKTSQPTSNLAAEDELESQLKETEQAIPTDSIADQLAPAIYRASNSKIWDLLHTKLELSFDWENEKVIGIAYLELKPYFYPQDNLVLDAKGFDILKIGLVTREGQQDLIFDYDENQINIELPREYTRTEKILIKVEYVAAPGSRELSGSDAISSDKGLYFVNPKNEDPDKPQQIWTQGETQANSAWFPTIDSPNEKCTQEIYITVEERFKTLSNGVLVYSQKNENGTRTDYWKMDKPHAPYLFMLAVGEFSVVKDKWNDVPLEYWVEPEFEEYADDIFGNTPEMIGFFSELFDFPYPWNKYSQIVVRDFVSGAMENTTASVFMEDLQVTDREILDENWDYIIAHELMHQWFGDLVTTESWSNLPLNEGFANYAEYLWNEYKYGVDEADYSNWIETQNYLDEAETKQVPLIRFYYDDREDMFDSHSYDKAGRVLHMLRKYVGDEAFFKSLNHYLKANAYQSVEIHNLRLSFEYITGEDLNWFFDQWFLSPGHPVIQIEHEYSNDSLHLYVYQLQDTTTSPVFILPSYIDVYINDEIDRFPLLIQDQNEKYSFYYSSKPDLVVFDSDQQLLGDINHTKIAEELIYQYSHSDKFLLRFTALNEVMELGSDSQRITIIRRALDDRFWRIRITAIELAEEYGILEDDGVLAAIQDLFNDKKSLVRASSLGALTQRDPEAYRDLIMLGLTDSSYSVAGTALAAYMIVSDTPDPDLIEKFSNSMNINALIPVADYYISNRYSDSYDWFFKKSKKLKGTDLYFFLQYFAQYLMDAPEDRRKLGVNIFEDLALNHQQYYIRLAGFQGLLILSDLEGVDEKIQRIKEQETDARLIQYYGQF
ncbi:MAG: M1 family metallopeptidase [Bacteroidetes bacterium]|nr:M1 family metallopeptidase [Bacteroidota bacterium]MDA1119518.1 M1 family metallopeptidase [Bacteroidota bacterium]